MKNLGRKLRRERRGDRSSLNSSMFYLSLSIQWMAGKRIYSSEKAVTFKIVSGKRSFRKGQFGDLLVSIFMIQQFASSSSFSSFFESDIEEKRINRRKEKDSYLFVNVRYLFSNNRIRITLYPRRTQKQNLILIAIFTNIFQALFARILDKKGKKKKRIINYIYSTFIKRKIIGRIDGREREREKRRVKSWTEIGWDIRLGKLVVYAQAGVYVDTGVYTTCAF